MVRTPCCGKNGLNKGAWTPEEDKKLMAYVTRYGCWNWRQLPKFAGLSRCGKSCRLRWLNYLRPNIKRGNYTKEEEDTIIRLHESMGNRWSAIAAQLPGRTDNEIKNHWHTNLKKRLKQKSSSSLSSSPSPASPVTNDQAQTTQEASGINEEEHPPHDQEEIRQQQQQQETGGGGSDPIHNYTPNPVALPIIIDSPTTISSPQPSTSDFSAADAIAGTGTGTGTVTTTDDDFAFLEAYYDAPATGDFWTEPFLSDNYYMPSEFLQAPLVDPFDDNFQFLDYEDILSPYELTMEEYL